MFWEEQNLLSTPGDAKTPGDRQQVIDRNFYRFFKVFTVFMPGCVPFPRLVPGKKTHFKRVSSFPIRN